MLFVPYSSGTAIELNQPKALELLAEQRIRAISQDSKGFMWFASQSDVWRFDGLELKAIDDFIELTEQSAQKPKEISNILITPESVIWIATKQTGLYRLQDNQIKQFKHNSNVLNQINSNKVRSLFYDSKDNLWIGTSKGLNKHTIDGRFTSYPFPNIEPDSLENDVTSITPIDDNNLLISTQKMLFKLDLNKSEFESIPIESTNNELFIFSTYVDQQNNFLIGTNFGVFIKKPEMAGFVQWLPDMITTSAPAIVDNEDYIWVGSLQNGMYQYDKKTKSVSNYQQNPNHTDGLKDNNITQLFKDQAQNIWVNSFYGGVQNFHPRTFLFSSGDSTQKIKTCAESKVFMGFNESLQTLWAVTNSEVVSIDLVTGLCTKYSKSLNSDKIFKSNQPVGILIDSSKKIWIPTSNGLFKIDQEKQLVDTSHQINNELVILFAAEFKTDILLLGTLNGLVLYDTENKTKKYLSSALSNHTSTHFYSYAKTKTGNFLLATNQGIMELNTEQQLQELTQLNQTLPTSTVFSLKLNNDELWIGTYLDGLFKYNFATQAVTNFNPITHLTEGVSINSILLDDFKHLWLGTSNGLMRFDPEKNTTNKFTIDEGVRSEYFIRSSSFKSKTGQLYFGGRSGFNAFNPKEIKVESQQPHVVITELKRFSKRIIPGVTYDGFKMNRPISDTEKLTFTHRDYVIGFEFAALNYTNPDGIQYAFKLEGFDPGWNYVDATDRTATYTNLPRGNYNFRVKASNKGGKWHERGTSLHIQVLPAPWLSWWAISLYVLSFIMLAFILINRKLQANQRLANLLRVEVKEKTKELQLQKQTVESLLAKKNELFSNVSHEFRTPLTLILGPMAELIETSQSQKSRQSLTVLKRNANRLLSLVEQLLHLAKTSDFKAAKFIEQRTDQQISAIIESFQHLARDKKINLVLDKNHQAYISATEQCLDATLGNLVSNAIKYSPSGGSIEVTSLLTKDQLIISVIDQGAGITDKQKTEVFKRFKRLDAHQNIAGIGIGLSVAKELIEINHGSISIESELGVGSRFTITLPTVENSSDSVTQPYQPGTLIDQLSQADDEMPVIEYKNALVNNKNIVLVIEDNHDMRNHIVDVLQAEYHCLQAKNGREGVATAIEYIPDLIICDVMMPEMDGFKVSRIIRSDMRTSHIPLVLLTALNDRENRIKGWREHVDVYMTKPFDRQELLIQVDNIITIRNILKKKARIKIAKNKTTKHSDLPKKDFEFVEKLIQTIKNNYQDPQLNRDRIAAKMAVSDRQLQRKIKALIDQNPMDMLREYRLKKAAEKLKDGYQVALSSDAAGFKTPTHFSQCFKAHYGMTPKQYQQQFKKKITD